MKLEKVLDNLNSIEKNSFVKIIDSILSENPQATKEAEKISNTNAKDLKNADSQNLVSIYKIVEDSYREKVKAQVDHTTSQTDVLLDLLIRDGNSIMSLEWLQKLYEKEISRLNNKKKEIAKIFNEESSSIDIEESRKRDYNVYRKCLKTAYNTDIKQNREPHISSSENEILVALANALDLSQEESRLINYTILNLDKQKIDEIIDELKYAGIIFYSKKSRTLYIPDEFVISFRKIRGKEIADKFFKRILRNLKDAQINLVAKKHNIDRKLSTQEKIDEIIAQGINVRNVLVEGIYREGTSKTDKKNFINDFIEKQLKIELTQKGSTLEDKVSLLLEYYTNEETKSDLNITVDGFALLIKDLQDLVPNSIKKIRHEFEIEESEDITVERLLDYNIKPQDILYLLSDEELKVFCEKKGVKSRGNLFENIILSYHDANNMLLEAYSLIATRDFNSLKERGLDIKDAEIGLKFEQVTRIILSELGFNIDEKLCKQVSTAKDKIDILINLGDNNIILVECKTNKESGYNKYSSIKRQIKAYNDLLKKNNINVLRTLLVAPDFSDSFVAECELEMEISISLLSSEVLKKIHNAFKKSKYVTLPHQLFLKDMVIDDERIIKALNR